DTTSSVTSGNSTKLHELETNVDQGLPTPNTSSGATLDDLPSQEVDDWPLNDAAHCLPPSYASNDPAGFDFIGPDSWELFDLGFGERLPQPDLIERL
ncbi:hypothetical protein LTS18_011136, partial [Coniosporium uncinatum]